jgi:16S rRNA (adenine1518-N6/adenine1519-N6)-dimethyltransferase
VVEGDALRVDWSAFALEAPALLVSNLPYQISTHLMIERCFGPLAIKYMVLMFQKEVAERLTASPRSKDYGQLSVMAQLHFRMRRVAEASPRDFFPPPKVASRVLAFERVDGVEAELGTAFFKFVKAAFAFRRKFLLKNLKGVVDKSGWARLHSGLEALGFSDKVRAEELSPADFARLFKTVYEH